MSVLERRVEKLEATAKPLPMTAPILLFNYEDGNITASFNGKNYTSRPNETAEMFQARVEEDQGQELFGIVIAPLVGEGNQK